MRIILTLCMLTPFLTAIEPPLPDVLKVKVEGLNDLPHELNTYSRFKIDVPAKIGLPVTIGVSPGTTTQLISLVSFATGAITIGTHLIKNNSKKDEVSYVTLGAGIGLIALGLLLNKWNTQGTSDEPPQKDQEEPVNTSASEQHTGGLPGEPSNLL